MSCVLATTAWLIIDIKSRKPQRSENYFKARILNPLQVPRALANSPKLSEAT
ncbi:MAG: hypothetical protein R2880_08660 [Deinococcales bacterium]